jgi:hypothetical protein
LCDHRKFVSQTSMPITITSTGGLYQLVLRRAMQTDRRRQAVEY